YDDPKNADCACLIGTDLRSIAGIEKAGGQQEAALADYHRAIGIFEELAAAEPQRSRWKSFIAETALDLSATYGNLVGGYPAVYYAEKAVSIRQDVAIQPTADSQERIAYAVALENLALQAQTRRKLQQGDEAVASLRLALASYSEANRIRNGVLDVDPE